MLPLIVAMCVSTIWGRYHYVADIFGGIVTGTLGYVIGSRIMIKSDHYFIHRLRQCEEVLIE